MTTQTIWGCHFTPPWGKSAFCLGLNVIWASLIPGVLHCWALQRTFCTFGGSSHSLYGRDYETGNIVEFTINEWCRLYYFPLKFQPCIFLISNIFRQPASFYLVSWNSRPAIIRISTCHHKNLDLSSWKSRTIIIKSRPVIIKFSTVHNKFSIYHHENKSRL